MSTTRTILRQALWRLERGNIAPALLLLGALAGMTFCSVVDAQVAFRSASSATQSAPTFRAAASAGIPASTTIAFRAAASAGVASGVTTLTITKPTGTVQNDVMITSIAIRPNTATIALLAGWTLVQRVDNANTSVNSLAVYWKVAGASEPASYAWTLGNAPTGAAGGIQTFSGVDTTTPIDVQNGAFTTVATTTPATPTVTTRVANTMLVTSHGIANGDLWANPPTWGGTQGFQQISTGNEMIQGSYALQAAIGATGTKTATDQGGQAADNGNAHILALRPVGADLTINKPTGTALNDVMIAAIAVRPYTVATTPPAGWALVTSILNNNEPTFASSWLLVYSKVAGASEPASYTWTPSVAHTGMVGGIQSFYNVDTTTPIDVQQGQNWPTPPAATLSFSTPSVTTTAANTMLVTSHEFTSSATWSPPTPPLMAQGFAVASVPPPNTVGISMEGNYLVQAGAGATGVKTATASNDPDVGNAHILALRGTWTGTATTISATFASNVLAGNLIAVYVTYDGTGTLNSVTDSLGNTYTIVQTISDGTHVQKSATAYAKNIAGGANTVTATFASAICCRLIIAHEITGADTAAPLDGGVGVGFSGQVQAAPGNGANAVTSGNMTTVTNGDYIFGATSDSSGLTTQTISAGTGETIRVNSSGATGNATASEEKIQATAGAVASTFTFNVTAGTSLTMQMAFKPVATGGTPGSFNAYETSTAAGAITGVIKTRIAGSTVSLDIIALNAAKTAIATTFTGTVRVEVMNSSNNTGALDANGCRPTTWTVIQTLSPDPAFVSGDNGRKTISFTQANSYPDVRLRITYPAGAPTVTGCSTDNFAIRPNTLASFAVTDTDWQTAGTGRALNLLTFAATTPTHKAGQPLSVRATALNAAGTPATTTNYVGAPAATLSACAGAACTATFGTLTLTTTFAAGQLVSDVASYDNVGSFALQLVDSTFASVDAADTTGDCTASGRYVCSATVSVGRFVPDHFAVALNTPAFGTACGAGGFTYIGQAFNYTTAPVITVTAQGLANNTTTLYATSGSWWRITNASLTGESYTVASGTLDTSGLPGTDPVIAATGSGVGTLTFGSGTGLFFTRTTPVAPFNADLSLAINVIDADGVTYASNPARFATATAGNGIAFSSGKPMRFGRLTIRNANGSQLVALPVQVEAQYWLGAPNNAFVTNTSDSCTTIAAANVAMSNFTNNLSGSPTCGTAISGGGLLSAGRRTLQLAAPGSANNGGVTLTVNLGASASGTTCTTVGAAPVSATTANLPYLQGNWTGGTYNVNPSARATFGVYKGSDEVIFIRENF